MKIWTPSTHFLPSEGLLMPPQLLLFFKLPYSQLIRYSNIINHLRQEQLSVFSKSGSEIPSSPPLTTIKAFPSAFIYFCNTGAQAHPFVKFSVYTNYCKIVHKHGIHASSSRNRSHPRAWRVKLGRLVTDQHSQDTKLTLYVFILYPNSKAASPAMSNRTFTLSCTKGNYQQRSWIPSAARKLGAQHWQLLCWATSESHCAIPVPAGAAGFLSTPSRPSSALIVQICTMGSSEWPDESCVEITFLFLLNEPVRGAEYSIQELWWVGAFLSDWFCSTVCPIFISLLL